MNVTIEHIPDSLRFKSTSDDDRAIVLNGSYDSEHKEQSPMQALLSAVAACSSVDVVEILRKMRQPLERLQVKASGNRREKIPRKFTSIQLHFILTGNLKVKKVEKVLEMSVRKYCSVAETLQPGVDIDYSYEILN